MISPDLIRRFGKHQHVLLKINHIVWSDGCSAQFLPRFLFKLLSNIASSLKIMWCYKQRHHGKGSMDRIGETSKNCVYRDVMSGKCVIDTPKQVAEYADKAVTSITSLYLPADVLIEPDNIEASL